MAVHVSEPPVNSIVTKCQLPVIEPQQMKNGRVEIMDG